MYENPILSQGSGRPVFVRVLPLVVAGAVLLLLPMATHAVRQPALLTLATHALIYAIAAGSLNLALGGGGMVSFGHAAFFGIGGYTVGILYQGFAQDSLFLGIIPGTNSLLITVPAAILVAGLASLTIGALCLRTSGVQFIMITLAFAQMVFFLFVSLKAYGGDDGLIIRRRNTLPYLDMREDTTFYFVCLLAAGIVYLLLARTARSRFGMLLGGIRQSGRRVSAIGYAVYPYKLVAFTLSGMGAGLAGALMANDLRFVSPDMLHWARSGELLIMVILGGVGTVAGPFLGAFAFVALESLLSPWIDHPQLVMGAILLLVVLFNPGGLGAILTRARGESR